MGNLSLLLVGFCFFNMERFLYVLASLNASVCGQNWSVLSSVLYFLDTRQERDARVYTAKYFCSKNFQLNLLLAPFSFFLFVDAIYYSNVGRVEPSGALLSLIILRD